MRAYTAGNTDVPLLEETIGHNFERMAARFPFHDALVEAAPVPGGDARRWSYTKMNDDVDRLARALLALGIARGERVGIWSPNCAEWTLVQYASAKAGAVLVPLDPAGAGPGLEDVVRQSGTRLLLAAPSDGSRDYVGMSRQALAQCPGLEHVVFLPDAGQEGLDAGVPDGEAELTYAELLKRADAVGHSALKDRMAELDPEDPAGLLFERGGRDFGDGATLTHREILNTGFSLGEQLGYTEDDRVVLPVPLFRRFGMVVGSLAAFSHGAAAIISGRGFSPAAALESVQDFGGTSLLGETGMFMAELELPDFASYDLSTLRTGVLEDGGPSAVLDRIIRAMNMEALAVWDETQTVLVPKRKDNPEH